MICGQFYSIEIYFYRKNKNVRKAIIYDSLKIIPFKVEKIAKAFNLNESKLELDYNTPRAKGHILTKEEKDYITNDVVIVSKALSVLFSENLTKMTAGSNAVLDFKRSININQYDHYFPPLDLLLDNDIRKAYKGGFTYLNPIYKEKEVRQSV